MFEIQFVANEIIFEQSNNPNDLVQKVQTTVFSILKALSYSLFHYKAGLLTN